MAVALSFPLFACTTYKSEEPAVSIETEAGKIHLNSLVLDAHADIALPSTAAAYLSPDGSSKVSPDKLRAGKVDAIVMSIAVGPGDRNPMADAEARALADEKLAAIQSLISANQNTLELATSLSEIEAAVKANKTAIILGFQNARSLQGKVDALDDFYNAGVRVFSLTHLAHNDFADSSRPRYLSEASAYEIAEEHGGLSALGKAAIKRINTLGGIIDVSQLSRAATLQAIKLSSSPVIASHSNVQAITNVTRNLSDSELDLIGETGGVVHIAAFGAYLVNLSESDTLAAIIAVRQKHGLQEAYSYPYELYWELADAKSKRAFLTEMRNVIGRGSISDMADHIDYVVKRIGIDHVGVGNDFNHGSGIEGYADASESLNLTIELLKRGYSRADIQKIWGENFLRVFRQAELAKAL